MAANITITRVSTGAGNSPELMRSNRDRELVKLTGAATAVDDTGTYTVQGFIPSANAFVVGGGFDITNVSGRVVTIRTKYALGNAVAHIEIVNPI